MDARHLSDRLKKVAKFVPKDARLADIGSDHAYLPAYLAINKIISYAVAGEVAKGPYENAVTEINTERLDHMIMPRLANGLKAIKTDDNIDTITIAGMGGPLIRDIFNADLEKLVGVRRLIIQPNVGQELIREWLMNHSYQIIDEDIVEDDHHIYEIIVAEKVSNKVGYSSLDLKYGPNLRVEQNEVFRAKWQRQMAKKREVLKHFAAANEVPIDKKKVLEIDIKEIEEMLK
ncbi:tRNA (adenine(22)-N(1))-methyltransferase [Dellaglioa carnosa]|uniref:tRNA (Adenine(22)-N(1))-methyltransferase TrmK n=1 Tax=Dellaglioa carnosa TaxID=2995136 RepID=A0ABT4JKK4_9LACO|nr:tRNA (adenine(22)-N(1))-methyltransferase TrmK [Dellaglioa carnosa]MCZ2490900.1 tRNA (adenine(22)-N(1))-methyltransferase TrmK [Dellaglioa carnosa]MCZ2493978.1 tRNA (adenine(22)-N(1))-methyltransferase TrmK [Dellaglioa carnosa]MDK1730842.1 tRNA (adenine(22)-N(1))-methyltransferase TrmK [Dellaglioa carnosa]